MPDVFSEEVGNLAAQLTEFLDGQRIRIALPALATVLIYLIETNPTPQPPEVQQLYALLTHLVRSFGHADQSVKRV